MAGLPLLRGVASLLLALTAFVFAAPASAQTKEHWVGAWSTAQLVPGGDNAAPVEDLTDATLRQVVRVTLGGRQLRVRFSNAFGNQPLAIDAASIARAPDNASSRVDPATLRSLTFGGKRRVVIPAGADYLSDPVALPVAAGADLAISIYLPRAPDRQTGHPGSRATSYFVHGDKVDAAELPGAKTAPRWFVIGGIEVDAPGASAVVILGDSITDGYGVEPNSNSRWPDFLMARMRGDKKTREMAVLNAGIGGNRLRLDGLGPNALARFERDVLSIPGVTHLIVLEGVNDLGTLTRDAPATPEQHAALVEEMIGVYRQIAARARAHGIKPIGATITPYGGSAYYHPDQLNEADRQAVNAWIRAPGNFDGVIDFDAAMRDTARPMFLRKEYDSDGLHPSIAGYKAMAEAVPLELLGGAKAKARKAAAPASKPAPALALTFDDLPVHAELPPGESHVGVITSIAATLREARVPGVYGFINGARAESDPAAAPALAAWRKAGHPLGNHGWSHTNLDSLTDAQFAEELARNEPLLKALAGDTDWHWFRYPFLSEGGASPERRARIRKLLAERGYKVAPVTMSFGDWGYNGPYARCMAKGDKAAVAKLEADWTAAAEAAIAESRAASEALYGRDIPYVLLMHVGAFDAHMLPELLDLYKRHGFRFVSLDEATRDSFYRTDRDPSLAPDPQGLDGQMRARGLPSQPRRAGLALDSLCR